MITLKQVLKQINIDDENNIEVKGITSDSRKVKDGYIFVALKGLHHNGKDYIKDAFLKGAVCVLNEEIENELIYKVKDLSAKLSVLAKYIYQLDFSKFHISAYTGTNGKTTTTTLIYKCLRNININVTLIGTNGVYYNEEHFPLNNTTPNLLEIYSILYESQKRGIFNVVMEVSSHAIELKRIDGLSFDIIGFTNISHDHLDFHSTMENYAMAKYKITRYLKEKGIVIHNQDDEYFSKYYDFSKFKNISFGLNSTQNKIENIILSNNGCRFSINGKFINSNLTCMFNVYNITLAYLSLLEYGIKSTDIIKGIKNIDSIDGRMQKIEVNKRYLYIDFAHSPDSIEKVLSYVKPLSKKKMIVVFGSGGDRDKSKRPKMLKVCLKYADKIYVTSDNPRYEDPFTIIKDIVKNKMSYKINIFLSREDAINDAFKYSNEFDTILLLGKGNENYQIIKDIKIPYSDIEVINRCLLNLEDSYI